MLLLLAPGVALAGQMVTYAPVTVEYRRVDIGRCVDSAAREYGLSSALLWKLIRAESGGDVTVMKRGAHVYRGLPMGDAASFLRHLVSTGRDVDVGLMQVNTVHLRELGLRRPELLLEPCFNVRAGAFLLAGLVKHLGYGWEAVAAYNAGLAGWLGKSRHGIRRSLRGAAYAKRVSRMKGRPMKVLLATEDTAPGRRVSMKEKGGMGIAVDYAFD